MSVGLFRKWAIGNFTAERSSCDRAKVPRDRKISKIHMIKDLFNA